MCCSSTAANSPMAQFIKSQSPEELWKASLKPKDPLKPDDPAKTDLTKTDQSDPTATQTIQTAKAPGTGLVLDVSA
jgi:hypothetical protein